MRISVCLLVKNEKPCLEIMLPKLPKPGPDSGFDELVAIDGGSTDGTQDILKKFNIPIIGQSGKGRGQAFHTAFNQLNSDAFIFYSPDGNEDENDIKKFKPLLEQGADLVIASRMMKGAWNEEDHSWWRPRKWANNVFNLMANLFFRKSGSYVSDSINGFRALTKKAAATMQLDAPDYTIEYQMTMRAFKHKLKIVEFPTHEGERVAGDTGAPSIPTGLRFIKRFWIELTR